MLTLIIEKKYSPTYSILMRSDTGEYLRKFEFFNADLPLWTTDPSDTLRFDWPDYAMINGRLVLERLGDPMNRSVGLKTAEVMIKGDELIIGKPSALCVW